MDNIEYEAKVLGVDVEDLTQRILRAGGVLVAGARLQRRHVFDIDRPANPARWMRLRTNGDTTTVSIKHIKHDGIDGTHEIETPVGDFDGMHLVLRELGYLPKSYQENRRTSFVLDGVQLEIDEWPLIPPYLEIEGPGKDEVVATAEALGYGIDDLTSENTREVYLRYGLDLSNFPELKF